jgi:hypothetical protein
MSNWPPQPGQYPPPAPIPVYPISQGAYGGVSPTGRPGILTAIAVCSIVIGSLGLPANIESMIQAFAFSVMASRTPKTMVARPVIAPPLASGKAEYIAPRGMSASQRQIVIAGLSQRRELSQARQDRLDALLADAGKRILNLAPESMTADSVAANVVSTMSMPSAAGGAADDVFILGTGRLQINDSTAVFFPSGNPSGIRSEGGSFSDAGGTHLAAVQINAIVDRIQTLADHRLNDTQVWKLESELQVAGQRIIGPANSVSEAVGQIQSAQMLADSTVGITTDINVFSIGPSGEMLPGIIPAKGYQQPGGANLSISHGVTTLIMVEAFLSFGAAAYLLVVGIMTLKNSNVARRLHLIYVVAKLGLFAVAMYTTYVVYQSIGGDSNNPAAGMLYVGLALSAIGIVYPIALVVAMNLRSVREFYKASIVGRVY